MSTNQSSNLGTETETLRAIYDALNRNDISGVFNFFDPQIERIEFEGSPGGGAYRGTADVKAHFSKGRETWAEGACTPERFIVAGDKIIALVHVRVRLKNKSEWLEGNTADVFTFRNGKVIEMRTFAEAKQALDWTGTKDPEAT